ncbi:MAG: ABC transporter ATP-binding protein, partial [Ferruginibacter sp.]
SIDFIENGTTSPAVQNVSFMASRGKLTAIVGESGSGKTATALSILGLLPQSAKVSGEILFSADETRRFKLNGLPENALKNIRGNQVSMIFQEPMTSLNPVLTCGFQVMESLITHKKLTRKDARAETIRIFEQVELPEPASMIGRYPHEISGGQKQRVMIAMAMSCKPDLLIADEPTTALDVRMQRNILQLIKKLQQSNNMAVLLITHDLGLVTDVADEIIVMYKGRIVEQGNAVTILNEPQHPYTKALLSCRPVSVQKGIKLPMLQDFLTDKTFVKHDVLKEKIVTPKENINEPALSVKQLKVYFPMNRNIFGRPGSYFKAVDDVSFDIGQSETIGLVGESGCGKTTLGRAILRLIKPTEGKILLDGKDITNVSTSESRLMARQLQIVFQDPYGSLNPRISIGKAILEPLMVHKLHTNNKERKEVVIDTLEKVQLQADHYKRFPHQFSGGQRQRICIARALILNPSFLVFDESVSALDVSVQAGILNLVNELKAAYHFTSIFISHDLAVVHYISDRILVMREGKIIEEGKADDIYFHPKMEYTKQLIEAIPGGRLN